jgi:hypothetical protein
MLLRSRLRLILVCVGLLGLGVAGWAVERTVTIEAPRLAVAGAPVSVVLAASTDAGQGERIGMFQADLSTDGGRTWAGFCYLDNIGPTTRQERTITAGAVGSEIRVRLRVAFRDGLAGDVDYRGAAIRWHAEWAEWQNPPAKTVTIPVAAR